MEELSEGAQVKQLGKKWSLLVASWIHPSLFKQACPNIDPTQPDSFGNEEANRLRTIQELYNFVPRSFHIPLEKKSWFGDSVCIHSYYLLLEFSWQYLLKFKAGVDAQRSSSLKRGREIIAIVLKDYKIPADVFQVGYDRSQHPEILKLVKFDPSKKKFDRNPPIFYPGLRRDVNFILRNRITNSRPISNSQSIIQCSPVH